MNDQQLDQLFLALAHPVRRQLLDQIRRQPGITLQQLLPAFSVSRIALMKHLAQLEQASLVTGLKQGRERPLYFNAVPLYWVHQRWSDQYSTFFASQLWSLKQAVEQTEDNPDEQQQQQHPGVTYPD